MESNTQQPDKPKSRAGRKKSPARAGGAIPELMKSHEVVVTPLAEQGGRVTKIEQTSQRNGVRLFRLHYVGDVRVECREPITLLEAWLAAVGWSARQMAFAYNLSPNTIRAQTFCPQVFKLLAQETGIHPLVLASNRTQAQWLLRFDEQGKVTDSEVALLPEETLQRIARDAGFVLPPRMAG